jgi:hypothetical protein
MSRVLCFHVWSHIASSGDQPRADTLPCDTQMGNKGFKKRCAMA